MGFGEGKYGTVEAAGRKLREGEPFFVLRGQDALMPAAVDAYASLLESAAVSIEQTAGDDPDLEARAAELRRGAADVMAFANRVRAWQVENDKHVKLPD